MKKNKGFTVVELGVSICLVTVVALLLFQLIASVKRLYTGSELQTTLLSKQAIIVRKIQNDLKQNNPVSITYCQNYLSNSCLAFTYNDGSVKELIVNPIEKKVSYGDYTIDYLAIDEDIIFGELSFDSTSDFFSIQIPITSNSITGTYDIKITKQASKIYNLGPLGDFSVPRNEGRIPILEQEDGIWMVVYDQSMTWVNEYVIKYLRNVKLNTCSINSSFSDKPVYELKTTTSRWCQDTNFYTQKASNYQSVSGLNAGALDKDSYREQIKNSLQSRQMFVKMDEYIERYTFKARGQ